LQKALFLSISLNFNCVAKWPVTLNPKKADKKIYFEPSISHWGRTKPTNREDLTNTPKKVTFLD